MRTRILSGIQPSGVLHIGNYLGMIRPMVGLQQKGELFCFIANMHSLTSVFNPDLLRENVHDALLDLLALGIDPEQSVLWVQSDIPEVTELTWYLSTVTPMGLLQRCHSYKDKVARNIPASSGLFMYPVLMAADILLYDTNVVPVGRDQQQHVEVTRDIAIKFNTTYGKTFTIPESEIREEIAVVPGTDGQKMSKSYGNSLEIFAPEKQLRKKIMSIVTDSAPVEAPKDPDKSYIFTLYKYFASPDEIDTLAIRFRNGGLGYGEAKKILFEHLMDYFSEYRQKREKLVNDKQYLEEVRKKGAEKARSRAAKVLSRVQKAIGII